MSLTRRLVPRFFTHARAFSSTAGTTPSNVKRSRWGRRAAYVALGAATVYGTDRTFNASAITRNLRTLWTCSVITADYKLNFTPEKSEEIPHIHERVAERMYNLFTSNGGLYIKIGQAIGANAAVLPPPMQTRFSTLFDAVPQIPFSTIASVITRELGAPPDQIFDYIDPVAAGSASVAQVHKARLKGSGEWVAVKVQKPDVRKQMNWDLAAYRAVMWVFEHWAFHLPVYFVVDFISDHLRRELDFVQEAKNAMETAKYIEGEPQLRGRVHIPRVYEELSTMQVMTAEWIDAVPLTDRARVYRLMGETPPTKTPEKSPYPNGRLCPEYDGPPLRGGVHAVIRTLVDLFSAQIFSFGPVMCDPHAGNVLVRPHPTERRKPQLVLLDHGLYVRLSPEFRRQYATLWRSLLSGDFGAIQRVTEAWGFGAPDLFASATLMRPVRFSANEEPNPDEPPPERWEDLSEYEQSVRMKARLRSFLSDTDRMPKELLFLGRNMRIVQGTNAAYGAPVNRVKLMGLWAARALPADPNLSFMGRIREWAGYAVFRSTLLALDVAFWAARIKQRFFGGGGFEDELERGMRGIAKGSFGVEMAPDAFDG